MSQTRFFSLGFSLGEFFAARSAARCSELEGHRSQSALIGLRAQTEVASGRQGRSRKAGVLNSASPYGLTPIRVTVISSKRPQTFVRLHLTRVSDAMRRDLRSSG